MKIFPTKLHFIYWTAPILIFALAVLIDVILNFLPEEMGNALNGFVIVLFFILGIVKIGILMFLFESIFDEVTFSNAMKISIMILAIVYYLIFGTPYYGVLFALFFGLRMNKHWKLF